MDKLQDELYRIIAARARIDIAVVTPDSTLRDLGVKSLDAAEIFFDIEEHFGIHFLNRGNHPDASVEQLVRHVHVALMQKRVLGTD
jgi:acyl carrier protein